MDAVKNWLRDNNIAFIENYKSHFGVTMDLKIPSLMIAVFLSNNEPKSDWEMSIYNASSKNKKFRMRWKYKPFFIRNSETKAFVLEKIKNCCFDRMLYMHRRWQKEQQKE